MGFGGEGVREREGRGKGKGGGNKGDISLSSYCAIRFSTSGIDYKMIEQITHHKGGISKLPIYSRRRKLTCFIR